MINIMGIGKFTRYKRKTLLRRFYRDYYFKIPGTTMINSPRNFFVYLLFSFSPNIRGSLVGSGVSFHRENTIRDRAIHRS